MDCRRGGPTGWAGGRGSWPWGVSGGRYAGGGQGNLGGRAALGSEAWGFQG